MKCNNMLKNSMVVLFLSSCLFAVNASASTVRYANAMKRTVDMEALITEGTIYEVAQIVTDKTASTDIFSIVDAGKYLVQLTDFNFPAPFAELGLSISTGTDLLGSIDGSGSFEFDAQPGNYFLSVFGVADTARMFSQYGVKISQLDGPVVSTPIPPAALLFGSGLIGLAGMSRKRFNRS
ncbi:MAG: hypothetical protein V3U84_08945 [Thiotrichaceae bacterium]